MPCQRDFMTAEIHVCVIQALYSQDSLPSCDIVSRKMQQNSRFSMPDITSLNSPVLRAGVTLYYSPEFMRKNQKPSQINDPWVIMDNNVGREVNTFLSDRVSLSSLSVALYFRCCISWTSHPVCLILIIIQNVIWDIFITCNRYSIIFTLFFQNLKILKFLYQIFISVPISIVYSQLV